MEGAVELGIRVLTLYTFSLENWDRGAREVSGLLLVIDATRPEELPRARQMLDLVGKDVPCVILANKSDLPGAMAEHAIRTGMKAPETAPVMFTVATEGKGVREALKVLAEMIVGVR